MESVRLIKSTAVKYINEIDSRASFRDIITWVRNYYGHWNTRVAHPNIYIASALIYRFTHPTSMRGRIKLSFAKCRAVDYVYNITVSA